MTRTRKSLKTVCAKFFGKIESTLVADLALRYCIHLKSISQNLLIHLIKSPQISQTISSRLQRCIQNSVKHLRWIVLQK